VSSGGALAPIEIEGVFARLGEVAHEYGRRTKQDHIAYASHFGLRDGAVITVRKDSYSEELEYGAVPLLAFRDMGAAVQGYIDAEDRERRRKAVENEQWEHGHYLRLKAKYEGQG
jgi:hypothetical protein